MPKNDFSGQNLDDVNLSGANMRESDLSKASLRRARMKGARLQDANLAESDLHGADLDHVDVTGADLRHADLTGANLHGVDLERAASTEGIRLAGATGVADELSHVPGDQAEQLRVGQTIDDLADINRDIITTARSLFDRSRVGRHAPTSADRRAAMERISELTRRRDALEHRLVTSIAEGMDPSQRRSSVEEEPDGERIASGGFSGDRGESGSAGLMSDPPRHIDSHPEVREVIGDEE